MNNYINRLWESCQKCVRRLLGSSIIVSRTTVEILFLIVGGSKLLITVFVDTEMISRLDPVFSQPWSLILIGTGIVEAATDAVFLFLPNRLICVYSLLCLTGALIGYRMIFWFSGSPESCHPLRIWRSPDFVLFRKWWQHGFVSSRFWNDNRLRKTNSASLARKFKSLSKFASEMIVIDYVAF